MEEMDTENGLEYRQDLKGCRQGLLIITIGTIIFWGGLIWLLSLIF